MFQFAKIHICSGISLQITIFNLQNIGFSRKSSDLTTPLDRNPSINKIHQKSQTSVDVFIRSNDKIGKFRLFSMLRFVKQMFSFWGF